MRRNNQDLPPITIFPIHRHVEKLNEFGLSSQFHIIIFIMEKYHGSWSLKFNHNVKYVCVLLSSAKILKRIGQVINSYHNVFFLFFEIGEPVNNVVMIIN